MITRRTFVASLSALAAFSPFARGKERVSPELTEKALEDALVDLYNHSPPNRFVTPDEVHAQMIEDYAQAVKLAGERIQEQFDKDILQGFIEWKYS